MGYGPRMSLRSLLYPEPERTGSLALLLVRVATGAMVLPHGWFKAANGAVGLAGGLASKGWPVPTFFAWSATLAELVGGALMIIGLFTRPAAAMVCFTMLVAWIGNHLADAARIGQGGGVAFEYPFLLSVLALAVAIAGPGRYAVDARLARR
jgi:putative oxidoreductase